MAVMKSLALLPGYFFSRVMGELVVMEDETGRCWSVEGRVCPGDKWQAVRSADLYHVGWEYRITWGFQDETDEPLEVRALPLLEPVARVVDEEP